MKKLTRVQITQRARARRKILDKEMAKRGLMPHRLYIDEYLYDRLKIIGAEVNMKPEETIFAAMRLFIERNGAEGDNNYRDHMCGIEAAVMMASVEMNEQGLIDLRKLTIEDAE